MSGVQPSAQPGAVLAVVGASGGVGASVLAVAVAVRARRAGVDVVLVDADPWGGGLDVTVGAEQEPGIRWAELAGLVGHADGRALLARLPSGDGVPVLSFDRVEAHPAGDVAAAVLAGLAGVCELVVVDVPGLPAPASAGDAALDAADQVLFVAAEGMRQVAALSVVAAHVRERGGAQVVTEVAVCLRGRSRQLGPLARVVESQLGLPVICTLADDPGAAADLVHGIAPGARDGGAVVVAADAVLGWAVLPRRDVA
jgi:secretion/DNA translocation related CpaE-like protein